MKPVERDREVSGESCRLDCEQGDSAKLGMGQKGGGRRRNAPRGQKKREGGGLLEDARQVAGRPALLACMQTGLGWALRLLLFLFWLLLRVSRMRARARWSVWVRGKVSLGDGEDTGRCHDADEECQQACRLIEVIPHCDSRYGLSSSYEVTPIRAVGSTTVEGMVMSGRKNGGERNPTNERRGQSNAVWPVRVRFRRRKSWRGWQGTPCPGHEI